jgi:hypothetical protein
MERRLGLGKLVVWTKKKEITLAHRNGSKRFHTHFLKFLVEPIFFVPLFFWGNLTSDQKFFMFFTIEEALTFNWSTYPSTEKVQKKVVRGSRIKREKGGEG